MPKNKQKSHPSALKHSGKARIGIRILILRLLPQPFSGWYIPVRLKSASPQAIGFGTYCTLRKNMGKTVMRLQDSAMAPGFQAGEPAGTPELRRALDELFSMTYEELRRLASSVKRSDPGATLNPTALVNEAWLKLGNSPRVASTSPLHFKRIAARAMRQHLRFSWTKKARRIGRISNWTYACRFGNRQR